MTSLARDEELRNKYKTLLMMLSSDFGEEGTSTDIMHVFESISFGQQNLLFSDETVMFKDINTVAGGTRNTYYTWAGRWTKAIRGVIVKVFNTFDVELD